LFSVKIFLGTKNINTTPSLKEPWVTNSQSVQGSIPNQKLLVSMVVKEKHMQVHFCWLITKEKHT